MSHNDDKRRIIGVTGTPGTGKKTISRILASLMSIRHIDLNTIALNGNTIMGEDEHGFIASTTKLRKLVKPILNAKDLILSGHLLPSVLKKNEVDFVFILRCEPETLKLRLIRRGYKPEKLLQNIGAEVLGVIYAETLNCFGYNKISEHNTTSENPEKIAENIVNICEGKSNLISPSIDWLSSTIDKSTLQRYFG